MTLNIRKPQTRTQLESRISEVDKLSQLLDNKFTVPGTKIGFGYDSILGLVPVVGDTISLGISTYILGIAYNCGVRKRTLVRMGGNMAYDYVIGLIPLVGDLLDVANKSNLKNAKILKSALERELTKTEYDVIDQQV